MLTRAFDRCKAEHADGGRTRATIPRLESGGGGTLMAIHSEHLETLEAVIATALNIVKNRTLADLYVRRDYAGDFRIRVQLESGQRYVITIKEE
jgi:hypothetical protein